MLEMEPDQPEAAALFVRYQDLHRILLEGTERELP